MRWFPLVALFACAPAASPSGPSPVELRTWELPPGYATRLVGSLQRTLGDVGRASEGPGGTLVVVAPAGVLGGVDALVREARDQQPPPAPRNVELQYWLVEGAPSDHPAAGPGLEPLQAAIEPLQRVDGPMTLTLLDTRRLRTYDGDRGEIADERLLVRQTVGIEPSGALLADVELQVERGAQVKTRIALADGQLAVLSQTSDTPGTSLYVVVRPTIAQ